MRIACVVHRYGAGIAGGSEGHCRAIASRLASRHDVTVLTTCARDHVTWRNELPAGESRDGPVHVVRFRVARRRSLGAFADISERVFSGGAPQAEQEEWFRANGPVAPGLLAHLEAHGAGYDIVLFWSFRYATAYFGLPIVADRAVLVPTAEEDPAIRLDVLERFFERPAGFVFLTPEEQSLVESRARGPLGPSAIVGAGLDPAPPDGPSLDADAIDPRLTGPFVLYLGRVDPNKGCETLLAYYLRYHQLRGAQAPLVLAGPPNMPIAAHHAIVPLGFVDGARRQALLSHASVLVVPSPYESLSLALLEGWNHARPGLVNAHCRVLEGQAERSNGALYYRDADEFAAALDFLLQHPAAAARLGRQGLDYVDREYRWPCVMARLEALLAEVAARRGRR